jgi:hypothetical protein
MFIQTIQFKREKDSEWEDGLYIAEHENANRDIIMDSNYLIVEGMIWDRKAGRFENNFIMIQSEKNI